jgi:type 1 glutamine amidotransferase
MESAHIGSAIGGLRIRAIDYPAARMPPLPAQIRLVTLLLLVASSAFGQHAAAPRPRILAFFTTGGELDHLLFAQQAMQALGAKADEAGYAFAATSNWDTLDDVTLRDVRLVIWLNDMPHTPAQREAFERYMARGGAWLGFHISGFGNRAWPWFGEFLGGSRFSASNWPSLPARLNVDEVTHPILRGIPPTFVAPTNEWYAWAPSPRVNPDVRVLLTLDASNFPLGVKNTLNGGDIPVAWINTRYRMVYLNFGHGNQIFSTPTLPAIIDNSVRWLLGLNAV